MALLHTPPGELGSLAPPFTLRGVDGKEHALIEYQSASVLVIMFLCNHCPYVQSIESRLVRLANEMAGKGVRFVAINSNDTETYPEDSFPNMVKRAQEKHYPFDYLLDATQEVARTYGAVCTPDLFVYNRERRLCYRGRLDDNPHNEQAVHKEDLKEAIVAMLAGTPLASTQHPSMGCSIKWRTTL